MTPQVYRATVTRWLDGDTAELDVDVQFFTLKTTVREVRVRIFGINCQELHSDDAARKEAAKAAMTFAGTIAPAMSVVTLQHHGLDKYGRDLGSLTLADGRDFGTVMLDTKNALPYDGHGPRPV